MNDAAAYDLAQMILDDPLVVDPNYIAKPARFSILIHGGSSAPSLDGCIPNIPGLRSHQPQLAVRMVLQDRAYTSSIWYTRSK